MSQTYAWRLFKLFFVNIVFAIAIVSHSGADQPSEEKVAGLKSLDDHFPFVVPNTLEQWKARAEELNLQVRVSLGLHPMPTLSVANPVVHGRQSMDGYSVEKIYFESIPGLFVTGSLYRPANTPTSPKGLPAVLYAHGHWENGRFYETPENEVPKLLASGAERFKNAAINHMQAACVQLARMGCVVLQYDMIGYADNVQISYDRAHRFGVNIDNPTCPPGEWLLFSAEAEGYSQSIMGLHALNSLRAFEVLKSMPEVDGSRIAITGASGGGTQSFITAAIEPKISGAFPAVMVSTGMQGGCTCENACGLRIGTGNVEIASLIAPRPLAMTTAQDWTVTMPEDGFPQMQQLYSLYGKKDLIRLHPGPQFPHNYNHVSRVALYGFMNQLFELGLEEPILEKDFELLRTEELTVWNDAHPQPESGIEFEKQLTAQWSASVNDSLTIDKAEDQESASEKLRLLREGWDTLLSPAKRTSRRLSTEDIGNGVLLVLWDNETAAAGRIEKQGSSADDTATSIDLVLADAFDETSSSGPSVYKLMISDPLHGDGDSQPLVANPRRVAAYTYGYNEPRILRRLAVLLHMIHEVASKSGKSVRLVVSNQDAFLATAAVRCLNDENGKPIQQVIVQGGRTDAEGQFAKVDSIVDNHFLPGSLRYQGLAGLLSVVDQRVITFHP